MEGNKKSLGDAMEKGIDLREQILKLYGDYYRGELMKLVVIGGGNFVICLFKYLNVLVQISYNRTIFDIVSNKLEYHWKSINQCVQQPKCLNLAQPQI